MLDTVPICCCTGVECFGFVANENRMNFLRFYGKSFLKHSVRNTIVPFRFGFIAFLYLLKITILSVRQNLDCLFFYIRMLHAKFAAAVKWLRRNFNWCSFSQVIKAVEKGKLFVCQHDDFITKSCTMNELILSFGLPWRMSNFNMAVK